MALVNYDDSDMSDSNDDDATFLEGKVTTSHDSFDKHAHFYDKVESEYKMRMPKNAKPLLEPLNIHRTSGLNGKIILTIPTVAELDSSDESDADEPKVAKKQHFKAKSSQNLLDILPPTRSFIVKEGDKPIITGALVPRQAIRSVSARTSVSKPGIEGLTAEDDFLEDTAISPEGFFTFNSTQDASSASTTGEEVRRKARESILAAEAAAATASALKPVLPSSVVQPLEKKPINEWELQKRPRDKQGELEEEDDDEEETEALFTADTFIPGPERKRARMSRSGVGASSVAELLSASGGTKVREVRAEDLVAGSKLELIKDITSSRPKLDPKDHLVNNPGKLAFRKHQITWLAYKAQEQEYDLKEQWAEARRNQMLSRQKYGF